jgi:hypothetical protein
MDAKHFLAFSAELCVLRASAVKAVHVRQLRTVRGLWPLLWNPIARLVSTLAANSH